MAKLYFKFGAMGSSKTAQALITKFNYEERGMKVLFLKPSVDTRVGGNIVWSRIGLKAEATLITPAANLEELYLEKKETANVIIVDECQFLTEKQVDELGDVALFYDVPVLCFGLATDFTTKLFEGSKRLFEIAESIPEIKSICRCGSKATVNARLDENGRVLNKGEQFCLGGNDRYQAMCRRCWLEKLKEQGDIQRKEFEHEIEP